MKRKDCGNQVTHRKSVVEHFLTAAIAVLWMSAAPNAVAETVRMRPQTTVDRPQVRLRHIAALEGFTEETTVRLKDLVVCAGPGPGRQVVIHLSEIRALLNRSRINMALLCVEGASRCVVRQPYRVEGSPTGSSEAEPGGRAPASRPGQGTLEASIQSVIEGQLTGCRGQVEIDFGRSAADVLQLSAGQYQFDVEQVAGYGLGPMEFRVTISSGSGAPRVVHLPVFARLVAKVASAARPINRGQVIKGQDVTLQRRLFERLEEVGMTSLDAVVGQQAKRALRRGQLICKRDLKSVPLIKRNALVLVDASTLGIRMTLAAKALEDGSLGDVIKLRNESSKESFFARVVALGQARATEPTALAQAAQGGKR